MAEKSTLSPDVFARILRKHYVFEIATTLVERGVDPKEIREDLGKSTDNPEYLKLMQMEIGIIGESLPDLEIVVKELTLEAVVMMEGWIKAGKG